MSLLSLLDATLIATGSVYCAAILWLVRGLYRPSAKRGKQLPALSIIVAARNEERSLPDCLAALKKQSYSGEWDVVVVDDRSSDGTGELLASWAEKWPRLQVVRAADPPPFYCPKKSALAQGIAVAQGEVLLFTDADCRPPADWAQSTAAHFVDGVGLVAGHAQPQPGGSFLQRLLFVDNLAVGALGAGSFSQGKALSCTGRNLAYRRRVYDEVGGFESAGHLLGGDDVYFMRAVSKMAHWRLVFNRAVSVDCLRPAVDLPSVIQQKMRHAAKGGHYGGAALLLAIVVYLFHCVVGVGAVLALGGIYISKPFFTVWAGRWCVDFLLLRGMAKEGDGAWWVYWPVLEVLYIPYVVFLAAAGRLGLFRWKP